MRLSRRGERGASQAGSSPLNKEAWTIRLIFPSPATINFGFIGKSSSDSSPGCGIGGSYRRLDSDQHNGSQNLRAVFLSPIHPPLIML